MHRVTCIGTVSGPAQTANHGAHIVGIDHEAGCAVRLVYVFEYPLALMLHSAGFAATQRTMKVAGTRGASEGGCVFDAETSAGGYLYSSGGDLYQSCQPVGSCEDIALAARGKDAPAACGDDVFERLLERCRVVEGTMKRDLKRCSQVDQGARAFDVYCAVGVQDAEDEAAGSEGTGVQEIFAHQRELIVGVEKVAAPGPQQDVHREPAALHCCAYQAVAWCEAAFAERGAEFNAIGSAFARGEASLDALCTKFEDDLAH